MDASREVRDALGQSHRLRQSFSVSRAPSAAGAEIVVTRESHEGLESDRTTRVQLSEHASDPLLGEIVHGFVARELVAVPSLAPGVRAARLRAHDIGLRPEFRINRLPVSGRSRLEVLRAGADGERGLGEGVLEFWKDLPDERLLIVFDVARDSLLSVRSEHASGRVVDVKPNASGMLVQAVGGGQGTLTLDVRRTSGGH